MDLGYLNLIVFSMIKETLKDNFSIRWVIALKEEAQIIITQFKMSLLSQTSVFPIFKNFEGKQSIYD